MRGILEEGRHHQSAGRVFAAAAFLTIVFYAALTAVILGVLRAFGVV